MSDLLEIQSFLNSHCSERNAFLKIKCTCWENVQINVLVVTFKIPLLLMRFAGVTCAASYSEIFPSCVLERWILLLFFKSFYQSCLFSIHLCVDGIYSTQNVGLLCKEKVRYLSTTSV